jgi:YVTN family beta-propeller protein
MRQRRFLVAVALLATAGISTALSLDNGPASKQRTAASGSSARAAVVRHDIYAADAANAPLAPRLQRIKARVYVPNSKSGTVDVIDPATYRIVRHFRVGLYSQHITPSWDMRWLYVNNTLSNSLTVVDPRTARPVGTIPLRNPYNLYFTPDGSKAIVVAETYERLDFRNRRTFALIKSVPIPAAGPNHLDFSADGRTLLISAEFSGYVVRVDTVDMAVTGRVYVGGTPIDVKVSPDGSVFYVANMVRDGVSVIDPTSMREIAFLRTARGAHGLAVSRDGKTLYVSNRASGSISLIDFATQKVTRTWQVGGNPDMMQLTPDGRRIWVSNRNRGTVSVIDAQTGWVLRRIRVGRSPHGLTYFPQQGRFSIGHNGLYR